MNNTNITDQIADLVVQSFNDVKENHQQLASFAQDRLNAHHKSNVGIVMAQVLDFESALNTKKNDAHAELDNMVAGFKADAMALVDNDGDPYRGLTVLTNLIETKKQEFEEVIQEMTDSIKSAYDNWNSHFGTLESFTDHVGGGK